MRRREFVVGAVTGVVGTGLAVAGGMGYRKSAGYAGRPSFSQQGEDIVLWHATRDILKTEHPTYMDVGAADPMKGNNTYLMYGTGGHGALIEPNPTFVEQLKAHRPHDIVVAAGIGVDATKEADYYVVQDNPMLNTFSPEQAEYLKTHGHPIDRVMKMPLLTLNTVMADNLGKAPDVLSTDIEGWDFKILQSLDFDRFRPGVICAETLPMNQKAENTEITQFLLSKGYVVRGGSLVNTIYLDARRLES